MSLIADALKAAQQEKSKRIPAPAATGMGGFFAVRGRSRTSEGMPKPLVIALVGLSGLIVVIALVTLLLSTTKTPPQTAAVAPPPVTEPVAPAVQGGTVSPVPAATLTDSASAVPVAGGTSTPSAVATGAAITGVPPAPLTGIVPRDTVHSLRTLADTPAPILATAPKPAGILKITMEDQPGSDARPLFQQALAAQRRGDVVRAKELYARALDRDPQNAELYNNVGMLYKSTGELDRAEDAYRRAVSLNPRLAAAWSNLGVLLDSRGRRKEAIAALQQAIAVDPTNVGVKVNLALQYHASGLYADARRLLEDAVRSNPTMPEAQYALAQTMEAQADRSSAIQHYDLFLSTSNGRFPQLERQVRQHLATLRAGL